MKPDIFAFHIYFIYLSIMMALDIKWTRISPDLSIENQICRPLYIEFYKEELMSAMAAYK